MRVIVRRRLSTFVVLCALSSGAHAGDAADTPSSGPAAGIELFASTDSDKTDVVKTLGRFSFLDKGPDSYAGIAVEQAWFKPLGGRTRKDERLYADLAGKAGSKLLWKARLGTDGRTWLGSANLRTKDWSKEVFIEREIVETPRGVDEGIYYTFIGASGDLPLSSVDTLTLTGALQAFTGNNERWHARANLVHVLKPSLGLSIQLRARYFHSTNPGEFDYYSPKNFVQALPVVQMRRFTASGWMILGAAGFGAQRATGSGWTTARLAELRAESPRGSAASAAFARSAKFNIRITRSMAQAIISM